MSVLSLPRVNFSGMTKWNPDTTNNYSNYYDSATSEPNFAATGTNPETYQNFIKENSVTDANGNWNIYGDQGTSFNNSLIDKVVEAAGPVTDDPWLGRPVKIAGLVSKNGQKKVPARLVDVDPYNSTSSQIFFDTFHLGDTEVGVVGKRLERFSDREFYFSRNLNLDGKVMIAGGMGVTWQSSFAKDELTWTGLDLSPALRDFKAQVDASGSSGLVVCFASYRTQYFTDCTYQGNQITTFDQLREAYLDGFTGSNPAYSVLMGSAGVWLADEPITGPSNRVLLPAAQLPLAQSVQSNGSSSSKVATYGTKTLGATSNHQEVGARSASADAATTYALGPAEAEAVIIDAAAGTGHVNLNFINTIPEINQELVKADFGTLTVQVRDLEETSKVTPIGTLSYADYDRAAYGKGAGILTLPFQSTDVVTALATGALELAGTNGQIALVETRLVVATDAKSMYLDEHQTKTVPLTLFDRGQLAEGETWRISVAQYDAGGVLIVDSQHRMARLLNAAGQELPVQSDGTVLLTVENGKVSFQAAPLQAGNFVLAYLPHAGGAPVHVPGNLNVAQSISNFRNLPFDADLRTFGPGETIPWDYLYANVLMVYDLVYPVMSLIIDFQSQEAVDGAYQKMLARTGKEIPGAAPPDLPTTSAFMPVTRELSTAKQHLLWRYLEQVAAAAAAAQATQD